jgi:protein ImuB
MLVQDHRPERSCSAQPATTLGAAGGHRPPSAPAGMPMSASRPVWLLPDPQPLRERSDLPVLDGAPLQLLSGPERIETGWWDGALAERDYFIAQGADGALVWVFRGRLPLSSTGQQQGWFLQGRFG